MYNDGVDRSKGVVYIKKMVTPRGMVRVRKRQYKLFDFIEKHYRGNVAKAARDVGVRRAYLAALIDGGQYGNHTVRRILAAFAKLDPSITYDQLFTPYSFEKIPEKKAFDLPAPIKPVRGDVKQEGASLFSRILDKHR